MFFARRRSLVAVVASTLFAGIAMTAAHAAQPDAFIGYVEDYQGSPKAFSIERADQTVVVAPTQVLNTGDKIIVVKPSDGKGKPNTMTINVAGSTYTIGTANSPFCVGSQDGKCGGAPVAATPEVVAVLTSLKNLLTSIVAPALGQAKADYDSAQSQPLRSRGAAGPPSMPIMLATPTAYISTDVAELVIPISGGNPPMHVSLISASGKSIAEQKNVTETDVHLAVPVLPIGKYMIEVEDASHAMASQHLEAVAAGTVPAADPSLQVAMNAQQAFVRDLALTGYATYLQSKGSQWYLSAYQTLQRTSPDYPPAHDLIFRLREGP